MSDRPPAPRALLLQLGLAALIAGIFFSYYQFASPYLCGTDPYYHIKFAELTRNRGVVLQFPWAQWSSWRDAFFDKEVLYHLLLSLFTFGDLIQGAKIANVVFSTGVFVAFLFLLLANRMRWPWFWWFLLLSSGGYLLFRISVTRPQVFSILLLLLGLHVLINERHYLVGLLSLLYSLSYTGHYQYVGLSLGYVGVVYLLEARLPWRLFVFALGGMLVGWLVHPNFPNNVSGFWLQNILVIANQWAPKVNLNMGGEMQPMTTRSLLGVNGATLIPLWVAFVIALVKRPQVSTRTVFLFAASTVYLILTLLTKRFAEYWIPVTALFHASFYGALFRGWEPIKAVVRFLSERRLAGAAVAVLLFPPAVLWALYTAISGRGRGLERFDGLAKTGGVLAIVGIAGGLGGLFVASHLDSFRQVNHCGEPNYAPSARFLARHAPAGAKVLTCDWDDAPYLFFFAPKQYYTVFLDPNFMYTWRPDVWHRWDRLTHAKDPDPAGTVRSVFGASYVYCTSDFGAFRSQLLRHGAQQIYPPAEARARHQACLRQGICSRCRTNGDCIEGMVCRRPGPPGREQREQPKRCEQDPYVFIFQLDTAAAPAR